MSAYTVTLRRISVAVIALLGFFLLPFGGTAAQLAGWAIKKRDAIG